MGLGEMGWLSFLDEQLGAECRHFYFLRPKTFVECSMQMHSVQVISSLNIVPIYTMDHTAHFYSQPSYR